jgi:predicted nucleotidyltransferase
MRQLQQVPGFEHIQFIILYGSAAGNCMNRESDIDLCVYYEGSSGDAAQFRHRALSNLPGSRYDIQIFQQLPLYVRIEVIRGLPVFVRNTRFLYERAIDTLRDFEDFKHRLYDYTGQARIQ